ncbi:hypothetical protein WJX74_002257 [Apatococcus lobatus]|uniref:Uncharacterized protein n=1 Tax=Apatococcus lobatus TaxID=904363 RepID=A0AAW1Q5G0_9CHLO
MDHYESLDKWKQDLRQTCIAYCGADDSIKEIGKELKPLRRTVRECGQRVMDLLGERDERRCDIHDHRVSLRMDSRACKRMPSKPQIRDRCLEYAGGEEKGEELFAFLMAPVSVDRTRLLRKKLQGEPPKPAFTEAVNDMLEDLEPEHDDFDGLT